MSDTFGFSKFPYPETNEKKLVPTTTEVYKDSRATNNPLRLWDEQLKQLTLLSATRDIKHVYMKLMHAINEAEFSQALYADPSLFIIDYQWANWIKLTKHTPISETQYLPRESYVHFSKDKFLVHKQCYNCSVQY